MLSKQLILCFQEYPQEVMASVSASSIDKGWAWMILIAAFFINILSFLVFFSGGIYVVVFMRELNASLTHVALIPSLCSGTLLSSGVVAGYLVERFGFRIVVIVGALIATIGYISSAFATSIYTLYISFGLLIGTGCGLTCMPNITILGFYFQKRKYFALAFSSVGTALCSFIFPPFLYYLIESYGWRGALLLQGGITLHMVVCGALERPLKISRAELKQSFLTRLQLELFKNSDFHVTVWQFYFLHGYFIFVIMINKYVISKGITAEESSFLSSMFGLGNVTGRILIAVLGLSPKWITRIKFPLVNTSTFAQGILFICIIFPTTFQTYSVVLFFVGIAYGIKIALIFSVSFELFEAKYANMIIGYSFFLSGIAVIIGPISANYLITWTNSMDSCMILTGITVLISGILTILMTRRISKLKKEKTKAIPTEMESLNANCNS